MYIYINKNVLSWRRKLSIDSDGTSFNDLECLLVQMYNESRDGATRCCVLQCAELSSRCLLTVRLTRRVRDTAPTARLAVLSTDTLSPTKAGVPGAVTVCTSLYCAFIISATAHVMRSGQSVCRSVCLSVCSVTQKVTRFRKVGLGSDWR